MKNQRCCYCGGVLSLCKDTGCDVDKERNLTDCNACRVDKGVSTTEQYRLTLSKKSNWPKHVFYFEVMSNNPTPIKEIIKNFL